MAPPLEPGRTFVAVSLTFLYLSFGLNLFGAADFERYYDHRYRFAADLPWVDAELSTPHFATFDRWSESLVLGRLAHAQRRGLFADGAFPGRFGADAVITPSLDRGAATHLLQYALFFHPEIEVDAPWISYRSQSGGQVFLLAILDRLIPGSGPWKLLLYYQLMALASATAVLWLGHWIYRRYGALAGWTLTVGTALAAYPALYGKNLWWVFPSYIVPMMIVVEVHERTARPLALFTAAWAGVQLKLLSSGFEFITAVGGSLLVALLHHQLRVPAPWKSYALRTAAVSAGAGVAGMLAVALVALQAGGIEGVEHLGRAFVRRADVDQALPFVELMWIHGAVAPLFDFRAIGLPVMLRTGPFLGLVVLAATTHAIWLRRNDELDALLAATGAAFLASISWLVFFPQHATIHQVHDSLIWFVPFNFFAFALLASVADRVRSRVASSLSKGARAGASR